MASKPSLVDEVLARARPSKTSIAWHERVPDDVMAELVAIRERYRAGQCGRMDATCLGRAIVESLTTRGIEMPKPRQVQQWLKR